MHWTSFIKMVALANVCLMWCSGLCSVQCTISWGDGCSWLFSHSNKNVITPPLSKHLKLVTRTLCARGDMISLHLPSLYAGSFVSEFYFWFLEKTILLLLSYCIDRSLFGGGRSKKRNSVQLSSRAVCACWWHSTFPAQVTTQKDRESQSKQVRQPWSCTWPGGHHKWTLSPHSWPQKEWLTG